MPNNAALAPTQLAAAACAMVPSSFWHLFSDVNPSVAYYHIVSDEEVPHTKYLYGHRNVAQFRADVDAFCRIFRPISLFDLLDHIRNGRPLPPKSFLLTFDDGFRELSDVIAPILRQKGVPATFFLTTACLDNKYLAHHNQISVLIDRLNRGVSKAVGDEIRALLMKIGIEVTEGSDFRGSLLRVGHQQQSTIEAVANILNVDFAEYLRTAKPYLTSEEVRGLMTAGFTIGGHSVDHPTYALIPLTEQVEQTRASVRFVQERFDLDYRAFAFPHGHNGVVGELFDRLGSEIDVYFGTAGITRSPFPRHLHRFSMENSDAPAHRIVARALARSVLKQAAA